MILVISSISHFAGRVHKAARVEVRDVEPHRDAVTSVCAGLEPDAVDAVVIGEDVPLSAALEFLAIVRAAVPAPVMLVRFQPELLRGSIVAEGFADIVDADAEVREVRGLLGEGFAHLAPAELDVSELDVPEPVSQEPPVEELALAQDVVDEPLTEDAFDILLREEFPEPPAERAAAPIRLEEPIESVEPEEPAVLLCGTDDNIDELFPEDVAAEVEPEVESAAAVTDDHGAEPLSDDVLARIAANDGSSEMWDTARDDADSEMPAEPLERRVIVVLSPKGGVGKTAVSANLAVAMAHRAKLQTVLVDLDDQFGCIASALNLSPQHTIEAAFTPDGVQQALVVKGLFNLYRDSLFVLCGSESPEALEKVRPEQVTSLLNQLTEDHAYVVVDTNPGLTEMTLAALDVATDLIVVANVDLAAVRAIRRAMDLLRRLDLVPPRVHLVMNQVESGSGLTEQDVAIALDLEVEASIERSAEVALSMNLGEPFVAHRRSSSAAKAISDLAKHIIGNNSSEAANGRRGSFWRLSR